MYKMPKQCPFRQDKLCVEEECKLWDENTGNCIINVGIAVCVSLLKEITETKRLKKEKKKGFIDKIMKVAEGAIEKAFEVEEEKESDKE